MTRQKTFGASEPCDTQSVDVSHGDNFVVVAHQVHLSQKGPTLMTFPCWHIA